MAQNFCKYHPQRVATWRCDHCHIDFCSSCLAQDEPDGEPACPLCQRPAVEIGDGQSAPPFWNRLPRFFLLPFQLHPFALLAATTLVSMLVGYRMFSAWLVQLLLMLMFYKFAYATLTRLARGHEHAPTLTQGLAGEGMELAVKQFFVFVLLFVVLGFVRVFLGTVAASIYYVAMILSIPASVMALAIERRFASAVDPTILFGIIKRIGVPYLALFFMLGVLSSGPAMIQRYMVKSVGGEYFALQKEDPRAVDPMEARRIKESFESKMFHLVIPVSIFANGYFTLVMFSMMGYVLFQNHRRLGLEVDEDTESIAESSAAKASEHPLLGDIEALIKEGRVEQAISRLRKRVLLHRQDRVLHDRFHGLLALSGDVPRLTGHGAEYIGMLLQSADRAKAVKVYRDCKRADSDFKLDSPNQVYPLAETMFGVGEYPLLVQLANGFHRAYPNHPDIPRLYLLVARTLSEGLNQEEKALPILQLLRQRYPDDPIAAQVDQYLATVEALLSVKGAST